MPQGYEREMRMRLSLDTRRALAAGEELGYNLNRVLSNNNLKINTKSIAQANKDVILLLQNLEAALNPTRRTIDLAMLDTLLQRSGKNLTDYARSLNRYGREGADAYLSLTKAISTAEAPTSRLSQNLKDAGDQLKRTVGWQLSSSAIHGVMSTYSLAISYAKELNRSLTDIRIVTGLNQVQMANFAKLANAAAKSLSSTTTRYTDAALIYYQQGLSEKLVKERTDVTLKMANVAGVSAQKASLLLTAIWNNFDNGSKSLEHYADVLVKLGAETASSSDEISKGVLKFAAIGNTVGLSYEYAASALATVTATTRESADTVGTSFRTLFSRLQGLSLGNTLDDGTTLNKYSKALDTVGVRIKETNGEIKSMDTILDELGAKWKTLGKDTQIGLAQTVGGARLYASFMALMDNWDYFQENVNRANNSAGALLKQQEIYAEGWEASSKRVQASMEGIFDSVINDKFVIGLNNVFAGALNGVDGLVKGFGGLGGIMSSVSSIFMMKYAKEMPRVLQDIGYNLDYAFNGKTGKLSAKQNLTFDAAREGLRAFAIAGDGIKVDDISKERGPKTYRYSSDTNMVLAQLLNNAQDSLNRRLQYLAVERTLSELEKLSYQKRLEVLDMWDNNIVSLAQTTQERVDMLKDEQKSMADNQYGTIVNEARTQREYNNYIKDNFNGSDTPEIDIIGGQGHYDLRTAEGRSAYREYVANSNYSEEEKQKLNARIDQLENFANSGVDMLNTGKLNSLTTEEQKIILEALGEGSADLDSFNEGIKRIQNGDNILSAQRQAISKGLTALQEPSIKTAKSIGKVDGALEKFTNILNTTSGSTERFDEDVSTSATKMVDTYKKSMSTFLDADKMTEGTYKLSDTGLKKLGLSREKDNLLIEDLEKSIAKSFKGINQFTIEEGNITGFKAGEDQRGLNDILEDIKKTNNNIVTITENNNSRYVDTDMMQAAREAGQAEFDLEDLIDSKGNENDDPKHQADPIEKTTLAAASVMSLMGTVQASISEYDTLMDKNASVFEKAMSLGGLGVSVAESFATLRETGETFGTDSKIGKFLSGSLGDLIPALGSSGTLGAIASAIPTAGLISAAATIIPAVVKGVADHTETNAETKARLELDYTNAKLRAEVAALNQDLLEKSISNYRSNIEKASLAQNGTYEKTKAINQANLDSFELIDKYNLEYDKDYTRENGLIKINQETLNKLQDGANDEVTASLNRSYGALAVNSLNSIQTLNELYQELATEKFGYDPMTITDSNGVPIYSSYEEALTAIGATDTDYDKVNQTIQNQEFMAQSNYASALQGIAEAEGQISETELGAIDLLSSSFDAKTQKLVADRIESQYGGNASTWSLFGGKTDEEVKLNAIKVLSEDKYNQILKSEEYNALADDTAKKQYIMDITKQEALSQEYAWQIELAEKSVGKLSNDYKNISNTSLMTLLALATEEIDEKDYQKALGQNYIATQYNKSISDLLKAIMEYTDENARTGDLNDELIKRGFTLSETTNLAQSMQEFGDNFGEDAAKSIYEATMKASNADRKVLINNLKDIDFSGSKINSLNQIYDLSEDLGGQFAEIFEDVKKSFGGDAGLFQEIANDKSIQKMMANFEKLGDIDAESIVKAAHSSEDLAMAMDMAGFNAGGLAAALEGVASGTIKEEQVTNSLLAGLSTLNQVDSIRADAYDSIDTYDKGRSVTEYGKFTSNLAKTVEYNLKNGYMFDETLMNAWGELFGEDRAYELQQDFINWLSADKNDISKSFNEKYKDEKEFLEAIQKNPYDLSALWKYAFKRSDVDVDEHYNDVWVGSNDTEKDKDTDHVSYNSVGEEEYRNAWNILYNDKYQGTRALTDPITDLERTAAEKVIAQALKEQKLNDKYVNINGAIYEVGGENGVTWNDETGKWETKDGKAPNVDNALFGWNERTGLVSFNEGFMESDMTLDEMRDYLAINMGMGENSADRMIADLMAQNTTMLKKFGDSQANEAIQVMSETALKNDEWVTQDLMETMFQSSNYLKNKYEAGGVDMWMADYFKGADLKEGLSEEERQAEMAKRAEFQKRYINFGDLDLRAATFEEADLALKQHTGMGTIDRLKSTKVKVKEDYGSVYVPSSNGYATGVVGEDVEKEGYDLSDTMLQLLAMGYSQTQAYEAMGQIMQDDNKVLIESVRDVDGNVLTYSTESKAYQDWSKLHGIEDSEENAEAFSNFISEQDAVARAVLEMAILALAQAQYNELYDENGKRRTDENGNPTQPEGAEEGDTEVTEDGEETSETSGEQQETATAADTPTPAPASGNGEDDQGGSSGGTNRNPLVDAINNGTIAYNGKDFYDPNKPTYRPGETGSEFMDRYNSYKPDPEVLAMIDAANELKSINDGLAAIGAKATGLNLKKIKKQYAKGRKRTEPYEGLALVGEVGPELSIDKNGNATMLGVNGPTYAYVEKDDIIFTADETKDILKTTPNLDNIPGFEWGIGGSSNIESSAYGKDNIWKGNSGSGGSDSGGGSGDDDWEPDRYVVIMELLQDLLREYTRLTKAKERAYGADKIKGLDAEIAKTNELIKAQKAYINEIELYREKDLQKLKDLGIDVEKEFIMDRNGVIRNFDEISEKYKKAAEEGNAEAGKKYEAIMKFMETNNLLQELADALVDMQWLLMDANIQRITTKVDIKVAVDDTDLLYLSYQLGKINEEAYDVAKALQIAGDSMEINLNKVSAYRQGLSETLGEAFNEMGLDENTQKTLFEKIDTGTLTLEDLDNFGISPDHSQNIMNVLLDYRLQLITINQLLDQLRDLVTTLVVKHFTNFTKDVGELTALINTYTNTLLTYANLTELLNGRFLGNMDKILTDINASLSKNAKDGIKNTELLVQAAELKYKELNEMYLAALKINDQETMDKVADARDTAYKELQEANNKFASAWMSANEAFLNEFKFGINQAIENFQEQLSPLFGTIDALSAAFERLNGLNELYVDDYEKYYQLNKLNRDLQTAIDETDNINNKKALAKLQEEINKEKASENKLSEYDLEVLKNKVELEKTRLALDEAKNAKSMVTLSRDLNGNWGYIYTAEEDKVAKAEQDYEDKLYEYQKANKEYLDDLQAMVIEALSNMIAALTELDVNDPHYEENKKSIIDSYMLTVAYVKEQMTAALGNQEDSRLVALERYDISMINLKNDFADLSLSFVTGEQNLENYFATLETSMPALLAQLNELEAKYEANIADINNYVTGNKNIALYMDENMDTLVTKSEEANEKIQGLYSTMVDDLADVNKEVADIYNNWLPRITEMAAKNEILAESISLILHELSDLSEVEVPPVLLGENWEHPDGYTENEYGVIRKLAENEIKLREEIKKDIKTDDKGVITNYNELKDKWYEDPPAEGEEDKRDADKKAKWDLLLKLIGYGVYIDPTAKKTIGLTDVWNTILSNAAAMYNAAATMALGLSGTTTVIELSVSITAEFPNVTNSSEIEDALNNLINDAAQYANRRS